MHNTVNSSARTVPKNDARIPKPPKPPEKPLMPYMRYSRKVWDRVKHENPQLKLWEVGRIIGQMWRELPDEEKNVYTEEYESEKLPYTEAMRQYQSSPAYQAWVVAKERAEKGIEDADMERKNLARSREKHEAPPVDLRESYILEDNEEDPDEQFTVKHVAAARFQRNHRLMQEILSDAKLPDPGQVITEARLYTLRTQVKQLKNHKKNLCSEIENCELRHQAKMRRIAEKSASFYADYRKLLSAKPRISEAQFSEMILKAKNDVLREEEEKKERQLAEAENRRLRQQQHQQQQQQQREAELVAAAAAAAESERRHQLQVQLQQQQPTPPVSQQPAESTNKEQQAPRTCPELFDEKEPSNELKSPNADVGDVQGGYACIPGRTSAAPPTVHSNVKQGLCQPSPSPSPQSQQQYPPNQSPMQRPEEQSDPRMSQYGQYSRSQAISGGYSPMGNQSNPTGPTPNQGPNMLPYPPPPHYPSMSGGVLGQSGQMLQQTPPNSDISNFGYPMDSAPFYGSTKGLSAAQSVSLPQTQTDFAGRKDAPGNEKQGLAMDNQGTSITTKKKKKSSISGSGSNNKEKKVCQSEQQQRPSVPTMGIDQQMDATMGDRGGKPQTGKFPQGYFDDLQRQGSPGMMQGSNPQFQQQQQPPPEYHPQTPGPPEARMGGAPGYHSNPSYYPPNSQAFTPQPRPYQTHAGMYSSNYPNQPTPPPIYHHPSQMVSSHMQAGQPVSQHVGQMNWSMHQQQQQQQAQQGLPQQPGNVYAQQQQYPGHPSMMRYPMPGNMGYQARPGFPGQPQQGPPQPPQQPNGGQESISPPQHHAPPAPPPYQQATMQQNYWPPTPAQQPSQPMSGNMMPQGPDMGGPHPAQYPGDRQRMPPSSGPDPIMRGSIQQQQPSGSVMGPGGQVGSGPQHSSMSGCYYPGYGPAQQVYGPQSGGNPQSGSYYGGPPQHMAGYGPQVSVGPPGNGGGQYMTTQGQSAAGMWQQQNFQPHQMPGSGSYMQPHYQGGPQQPPPPQQSGAPGGGQPPRQMMPPSRPVSKDDMSPSVSSPGVSMSTGGQSVGAQPVGGGPGQQPSSS